MGVDARPGREGLCNETVALALAASNVGTWDWRIADDVVRFDPIGAAMFGLPRAQTRLGVTHGSVLDRVHPEDRERLGSIIDDLRRRGGLYVAQYRTRLEAGAVRLILARGRFVPDAGGVVREARGIVIDVTDSSRDGRPDDAVFCMSEAAARGGIDRVAELALAMWSAAEDLAPGDFARLKPLMNAVLHEVGRQLAVGPSRPSNESLH